MTVPARMSLVTLGVADLARSTSFYERLGWRRSSVGGGEVSFFETTGGVLALYPFTALARDAGRPAGDRPAVGGMSIAINVEREGEVAQVLAEAEAAGATFVRPAAATAWGGTVGYFADPDGHLWEVAHNPGFAFDERGAIVLPE
ncbi:MAG TPA: VOC family protein [Acidimicrobiales bacterium]|nr:VOC family protein [Acidimicrobiales bacterium]